MARSQDRATATVEQTTARARLVQDPFLVYSSNIFAILGLRAMSLVLASMLDKFVYSKPGVAFSWCTRPQEDPERLDHIPTAWSLAVIVMTLATAIAAA